MTEVEELAETLGRYGKAAYLAPEHWRADLQRYTEAVQREAAAKLIEASDAYRPNTARHVHYREAADIVRPQ